MKIEVHHYIHGVEAETNRLLRALLKQGEAIMPQISEITQELNDVKATLEQVAVEEDTLQQTIVDLQAQIANMPAGPELDALKVAADAVVAQANVLAAKVPAPTT